MIDNNSGTWLFLEWRYWLFIKKNYKFSINIITGKQKRSVYDNWKLFFYKVHLVLMTSQYVTGQVLKIIVPDNFVFLINKWERTSAIQEKNGYVTYIYNNNQDLELLELVWRPFRWTTIDYYIGASSRLQRIAGFFGCVINTLSVWSCSLLCDGIVDYLTRLPLSFAILSIYDTMQMFYLLCNSIISSMYDFVLVFPFYSQPDKKKNHVCLTRLHTNIN